MVLVFPAPIVADVVLPHFQSFCDDRNALLLPLVIGCIACCSLCAWTVTLHSDSTVTIRPHFVDWMGKFVTDHQARLSVLMDKKNEQKKDGG